MYDPFKSKVSSRYGPPFNTGSTQKKRQMMIHRATAQWRGFNNLSHTESYTVIYAANSHTYYY